MPPHLISASYIIDGDLVLGSSLFLFVPLLGILVACYYLWFLRQRISKEVPRAAAAFAGLKAAWIGRKLLVRCSTSWKVPRKPFDGERRNIISRGGPEGGVSLANTEPATLSWRPGIN